MMCLCLSGEYPPLLLLRKSIDMDMDMEWFGRIASRGDPSIHHARPLTYKRTRSWSQNGDLLDKEDRPEKLEKPQPIGQRRN